MSELPREGTVVRQKYQLESTIGQGGMAVVYSAIHLHLQQRVAIKLLRPEAPREREVIERFLREARAASRLQGPHVARVIDVDTMDDGTPFIVMEHLEGSDLLALVRQRPLSIPEAVGYVREACDAIAEAHALGIIHRDVKPANLFLAKKRTGESIVKVLDFGISKVLEDTRITEEHVGMGSAEYMSPEQMRSATDVDARSDVWSLGVTLYELCTRHTPFHAEGVGAVIAAVLTKVPPSPRHYRPDVPPGLEAVILRCIEKDPALRHSSVAALSAALAPFATDQSAAASPFAASPFVAPSSPGGPVASALGASTFGGAGVTQGAQVSPSAQTALAANAAPAAPPAPAKVPVMAIVAAALAALIVIIVAFGLGSGSGGAQKPKPSRFRLEGETVVDAEMNLVWQRRPAPTAMDWSSASAHCARSGLRLPEIEELKGLLAVLAVEPPIDKESFTATPIDVFWSATEASRGAAMAMHFSTAHAASSVVSTRNRVRCVK